MRSGVGRQGKLLPIASFYSTGQSRTASHTHPPTRSRARLRI
jgi:hypothetical protein